MPSNGPTPGEPKDDINISDELNQFSELTDPRELNELITITDLLSDPASLLNVIMKYTTDGINIVAMNNNDTTRKLLFCNDRFVEMSGRSREELMATRDLGDFTKRIAGELAFGYVRDKINKDLVSRGFGSWNRPDGKDNMHEYATSRIGSHGDRILVIGIDRDVTDRTKMEDQLSQASKLEMIGKLAGGISHDFNNQLTVIKGYCDLLLQDLSDEKKTNEALKEIFDAAQRASSLTHQLLTFSRRQILTNRVINLNHTIEKLIGPLKRMIGEAISLEFIPFKDLDNVLVDEDRIIQAIMNMVVNARDAMPAGGKLTITTENVKMDDSYLTQIKDIFNEPKVMLSVSDTGIGMDKETLGHIYEPFFTTKDISQGTGLGLSTVYGLVQQSGGHIHVDSKPGEGTTFKVYLPRTDDPLEDREQIKTKTKQIVDLTGTESILVAEDEQEVLYLMFRTLRGLGYNAFGSANPKAAVTLGEHFEGKIDLLVSDIVMPGLSGIELAEKMVAKRPNLKILFITGYAPSDIKSKSLGDKIQVLQKPFDAIELATNVRQVLDQDTPATGIRS